MPFRLAQSSTPRMRAGLGVGSSVLRIKEMSVAGLALTPMRFARRAPPPHPERRRWRAAGESVSRLCEPVERQPPAAARRICGACRKCFCRRTYGDGASSAQDDLPTAGLSVNVGNDYAPRSRVPGTAGNGQPVSWIAQRRAGCRIRGKHPRARVQEFRVIKRGEMRVVKGPSVHDTPCQ